jgi:hypothetical protein
LPVTGSDKKAFANPPPGKVLSVFAVKKGSSYLEQICLK